MHFSKSVLMKKQSQLHLEWPEVSECEFLVNYSYKTRQMEENKRNSPQWWSIKEVVFAKQTHLTLTTLALSSPSVSSTAHHASWRIEDPAHWIPVKKHWPGTDGPQTGSWSAGTGPSVSRNPAPGTSQHCGSDPNLHPGPTDSAASQPSQWRKWAPCFHPH